MRDAAVPGYRLSKATFSSRILISLALLGITLGLFSAIALTLIKTGISPATVQVYYLGDTNPDSLGNLDLGEVPKPLNELAEVTHIHMIGGSMLLFLLCHLLSLCSISEGLRTTLYIVAFLSFLTTFGSPWLIVYVSPTFSYLYSISIPAFALALLVCTLVSLWEMWIVPRRT